MKRRFDLPPEARALELRLRLLEITDKHNLAIEEAAELLSQCAHRLLHPDEHKEPAKADRRSPDYRAAQIRAELIAAMKQEGVGLEQAAELFSECAGIVLNRKLVEDIAKAAGLRLDGYDLNRHLQLYYDIYRGRKSLGFICKGWSDPGFRLGDVLAVPKAKLPQLQAQSRKIMRLCVTNGIMVTVDEAERPVMLQMESVIYAEGFNQKTFEKALETLTECVGQVRELLA